MVALYYMYVLSYRDAYDTLKLIFWHQGLPILLCGCLVRLRRCQVKATQLTCTPMTGAPGYQS